MQGCRIKPDVAGYDIITMSVGSRLINGYINANDINMDNDTAMIRFNGSELFDYRGTLVQNMYLESYDWENLQLGPQYGTAIYYESDGQYGPSYIMWTLCNDITIYGFKYGLRFNSSNGHIYSSFNNGNIFNDILMARTQWGIYIDEPDYGEGTDLNATEGNFFTNIMVQPTWYSKGIVYCNGGKNNKFEIIDWDWNGTGRQWENKSVAYNFTSYSQRNYIETHIDVTDASVYNDTGNGNIVNSYGMFGGYLNLRYLERGYTSDPTNNPLYINKEGGSSVYFFSGTGAETASPPGIRIYNNNQTGPYLSLAVAYGAAPYTYITTPSASNAKLTINPDGRLDLISTTGIVYLGSSTNQIQLVSGAAVFIDDVLLLDGRTTDPSSLSDGMIWYNTTIDKFCCRANGVSYSLNMTAL